MANKYRIGTTIGVQVSIDNMPSETANMFVRSEYGTFDMNNVTVAKDIEGKPTGISGKFEAANQKYVGKYDVIIISSTKRLCIDNAFELVKHSDEADEIPTTNVVLDFSVSYLTCSTVVSGYEEWRQGHDGTIEDYWAFVREETRIVKIETDIETNKTDIKNEIDRATAAETTLSERINQEVTDRKASDETIATQLSNEINRANEMEQKIADELHKEIGRATAAENDLQEQIRRNTPTEIGLDEETGEVYATFLDESTVSRTYIAEDCELVAEIDEVGVNDDGELWSDIVVN